MKIPKQIDDSMMIVFIVSTVLGIISGVITAITLSIPMAVLTFSLLFFGLGVALPMNIFQRYKQK